MAENRFNDYCFLDRIRIREGNDQCKAVFSEICEKDKRRAAYLLNDRRLTFPSLYILLPQIQSFHIDGYLSPIKAIAARFAGSICGPPGCSPEADDPSERGNAAYAALKWVWETGYADDGLSDEYEELLEITASVLISLYKDTKVLPAVLDLIFKRNREGHNIHNLVWAAFQGRSPDILKLIAQRIRSSDERDAGLACSLLGIETPGTAADSQKRYDAYLQWLRENDPFLYFTGESLQFASRPAFYRIDPVRKYIHRGTPSYDWQPVMPADEQERNALAAFNALGDEEKTLLSEYSHQARKENPAEWKAWVQRPIDEQVKTAKLNRERIHDYGIGRSI